tara:strand:+ start:553 stop:834 length:282 start_codon:yes stop_codon:yes gene_type:complete
MNTTKQKLRKSFDIDYNDGFKQKIWFDNGYGISLVYHDGSYGLECALIHKDVDEIIQDNKKFNKFCGLNSVKGFMQGEDLLKALKVVKKLKSK